MIVLYSERGYIYTVDRKDWYLISFEILIAIWAVFYKQGWDRHEKAVALKWGKCVCVLCVLRECVLMHACE